jgi:hypothetical protein
VVGLLKRQQRLLVEDLALWREPNRSARRGEELDTEFTF